MVAVDADDKRLIRVQENLDRLKLQATVIHGDASKPDDWWNGELFDRILCDAHLVVQPVLFVAIPISAGYAATVILQISLHYKKAS